MRGRIPAGRRRAAGLRGRQPGLPPLEELPKVPPQASCSSPTGLKPSRVNPMVTEGEMDAGKAEGHMAALSSVEFRDDDCIGEKERRDIEYRPSVSASCF